MTAYTAQQITDIIFCAPTAERKAPPTGVRKLFASLTPSFLQKPSFENATYGPLKDGVAKLKLEGFSDQQINAFVVGLQTIAKGVAMDLTNEIVFKTGKVVMGEFDHDMNYPLGLKMRTSDNQAFIDAGFERRVYEAFLEDLEYSAKEYPDLMIVENAPIVVSATPQPPANT